MSGGNRSLWITAGDESATTTDTSQINLFASLFPWLATPTTPSTPAVPTVPTVPTTPSVPASTSLYINVGASTVPYTTDYNALVTELNTPVKVAAYEQSYFKYSFHNGFTPYSPSQFNSLQAGDCKDFAAFASAIDSANGYSANTYSFKYAEPSSGHTVSGVVYNSQQYFISDGHLIGPTDMQGFLNYESGNHGTDLPYGCNPNISTVATYDPNFLGSMPWSGISNNTGDAPFKNNSYSAVLTGSV